MPFRAFRSISSMFRDKKLAFFSAREGAKGVLVSFCAFHPISSMFLGGRALFRVSAKDINKNKIVIENIKMNYTLVNLSNESNFERLGSSNSLIDTFSELEVGREAYFRTYVKFRRPLTLVDSQMFTPELDALSLLELSSDSDHLFTSLVSAGLGSRLIDHFAECESSGMDYTDLDTGDVLMERVVRTISQDGEPNKSEKDFDSEIFYKLKSGMRSFHRFLELDKRFVPNILKGIESMLCKLVRVDLCIDLSEDIMPYVSHGIKTGQYKGFGRHPFAFGWLAGDRIEGAVGRNSKLSKSFKDKQLILDTAYFGNSRKSDEMAVFYNKRVERKEKAESSWAPKSRVEVRIYPRTEESQKIAISILESYLDEKDGWRNRISYFGEVLCRCVVFTTTKRPASPVEVKDVAPWWQLLLRALTVGSKGFEFPVDKSLLKSDLMLEMAKKSRGRPKGSKDKKTRKPGSGKKKV